MKKKLGISIAVAALVFAGSATAYAHPVGPPGEPDCYGNRISHGSSHSAKHEGHGWTPPERVAMAEEMFGEDLTVKDFHFFVKMNCAGEE